MSFSGNNLSGTARLLRTFLLLENRSGEPPRVTAFWISFRLLGSIPRRPWLVEANEGNQGQDAPGCAREGRDIGFHALLLSLPQQNRLGENRDALVITGRKNNRTREAECGKQGG